MKTINLYPPHIDTAPIIDGEKWPLNETREVFKILDSGKQKLVGVVGNGCTMCSRAKKREADAIVKPRLMRGKHPEQGRVLCVFSYLSFGVTVDHMVDLIRRVGFEGDLLIDIPIRCGTGATTESQMTRCSPYLRMSYHQFKPDRIICFGANASKSVLGISVPAWVNRWCWTTIPEEVATEDQYVSNRRIPVVSLMDPIAYNRSRVHREIIDSEVEWALKADFPDHRPVGMAYIVEGVEDLPAVERWVERVRQTTGWIAYDVETNGVMHNPDFSIIMCSVAATSIPHVLLWDKQALDNPALTERLVQLLTDPTIRKRGQNEKYDALSWLIWKGVTVAPVDGDCRLEMKLANADSKADLESLGFYVGVNAHKTEAKEWMQQAILSAKEDLDPDIEGVNAKAYAYKYLPSEVLSRYNALDTKVTAAVCQHARGLLGPLEKTLHRLVLPASELFKRIEYKGMAVDVNGIQAARQYLETEIASLAPRFEREGLDPDKPDTIRVWLENMGIDSPIKTDKGLASTNAKALKLVESKNELIAAILRHRKLAKLLSSYADTLPGYIRADGRVHPSFLLDGARSGRLSCIAGECRMLTNHGWVRMDRLPALIQEADVYTLTHANNWKRVTACWSNGVRPTMVVSNQSLSRGIRLTPDHRLQSARGDWVQAQDVDLAIIHMDESKTPLRYEIVHKGPAEPCEVFDFTVEDDHSACIEGFFAHNCTSPALQTIPSRGEMAKLIKNCFVATKGYKLVCLDFAILEIRIAAVLSGDPDMAVAAQGDFHTETAKALAQLAWNTTPEAVEAEIKGGNKSKRDTAKTLGFAILYGAGPHSIAESVGCSVQAAERLITGFLTKYKKLKAWMRDQVQFARDNACVDIPWLDGTIGRRRPLLNIHSADNGERGNAERGAVNSPIQSLASDICLSSAVKIDEWYRANSIPASIVCLVHDSIISEVREDFVDEVTRTKAHLMTSWPTGPVPLKVEAEVGYAWGSLQKVSV
jgi:DNA polymerase I-like protein with 3'-5' exonuclease and polymerase domains/uracil-DNA glycosylase